MNQLPGYAPQLQLSDPVGHANHVAPLEHPKAAAGWWRARHFLLDLDGTLVRQDVAVPHAAELLERVAGRYAVVSNNSTHTAVGLSRALHRIGLPIPARCIVLAGEHTLHLITQTQPALRIRLIASAALQRRAKELGCRLVDREPDVVVLARDERFTYATLTTIVNELRAGARLVVTNPDLHHPAHGGGLVPETGALMHAVIACSGVQPEQVIGKPGDLLFREGLRRLQARAVDTLMIGDNPSTDALGASRLGIRCVLVGEAGEAQVPSLAALLEAD
jgi:HAD superfamily hydrolase (TIGR01450 family)